MDKLPLLVYFIGPRLYQRFGKDGSARAYVPNVLEGTANSVFVACVIARSLGLFASPMLAYTAYRRGWLTADNCTRSLLGVAILYGSSYVFRGVGRMLNADYRQFASDLLLARTGETRRNTLLRLYDFDMWAKPVDYRWRDADPPVKRRFVESDQPSGGMFMDSLSYLAAHVLGRRLVFPGSVRALNALVHGALVDGRAKLVLKGGKRYKLQTRSGLTIDSMFVDRRGGQAGDVGQTLVISVEGNAGFYELGSMGTPVDAGYSVLGWNHPGFCGSSGEPWPRADAEAVDVVVQFATTRLGFAESDIVFLGWSIGGYAASWAAMNYPSLRGVFLDAVFDDLAPLAVSKMPPSLTRLVELTIRRHVDLPVLRQLERFGGPVTLMRRRRDEMICTDERDADARLRSNRVTPLLDGLLAARYPRLLDADTRPLLLQWLQADGDEQQRLARHLGVDDKQCVGALEAAAKSSAGQPLFPMQVGAGMGVLQRQRLLLFLAARYLLDFDTGHNTQLPARLFSIPKHPWQK